MSAATLRVRRKAKGFTLVEILIVVIILGILAAIVIPQFTSASQDARNNSLTSQVQTIRSQIELYKLQHTTDADELFSDTTSDATQWSLLTSRTGKNSGTTTVAATDTACGPYLQTMPVNGLNGKSKVLVNTTTTEATSGVIDATAGFVYNESTGKFFALDKSGNLYLGN